MQPRALCVHVLICASVFSVRLFASCSLCAGGTNIVLGKGPEDELVMYREGDLLGTFQK